MSDIDEIIAMLGIGEFKISAHAGQRMSERGITVEDIENVAETYWDFEYREDEDSYAIMGKDLSGHNLTVVAGLRSGRELWITLIITVY